MCKQVRKPKKLNQTTWHKPADIQNQKQRCECDQLVGSYHIYNPSLCITMEIYYIMESRITFPSVFVSNTAHVCGCISCMWLYSPCMWLYVMHFAGIEVTCELEWITTRQTWRGCCIVNYHTADISTVVHSISMSSFIYNYWHKEKYYDFFLMLP